MKAAFCNLLFLLLISFSSVMFAQTPYGTRDRSSFNDDWLFYKGDAAGATEKLDYTQVKNWLLPSGKRFAINGDQSKLQMPAGNLGEDVLFTHADFDDTSWRRLDLPHDWAIEGDFQQALPGDTGKRPFAGVGWYRKHFNVSAADKGKEFYIDFDGAMAYPEVWINGHFVGGWAYGYASFRLDLTPYVKLGGENVIAVRLDNPPDSSRWYPGSGIYRNVWLVKTNPIHVGQWGTYITTPSVTGDAADVNVKITIDNDSDESPDPIIKTSIYKLTAGSRLAKAVASSVTPADTAKHSSHTFETSLKLARPSLWSVNSPDLYQAVVQLSVKGKIVDSYQTNFGIRTIKFDVQQGFFLNGQHVYLKGVCDHHDLGALGSAINLRALERQLEILKEMGVNAIRTSHNPPAPELLDLADQMGFVVMDEGFDMWVSGKRPNDYHRAFPDWHGIDWRAQIRRDRNHPSVVLWSIGNEIGEQRDAKGHKIAAELTAIAHEEDPTRPTTAAANYAAAGYNGFQKTVDVFGSNYRWMEYEKFRKENPLIPLVGTETASAVSSRGEYFFPVSNDKSKGRQDFQVSSYDLYAPPWAWPPDTEFEAQDKNPFVAGEFVWTGFDYIGEPTPFGNDSKTMLEFTDRSDRARAENELKQFGVVRVPSRSSYFGIVDLCGFKKDRFYIYQARWRPDFPMAHILPHWNWPERVGQVTPVHVYTSGDEAELFLNGRSLGRKKRGQFEYRLRWDDVKYEPGELRVVAYKNGKKWAEDSVKTTGLASQLRLQADRSTINADGEDLSFVTVKIADQNGLQVPRSKNRLKVNISGPGEIVAMDNGDATDLESFQSLNRKAYNGLALVIVRSKRGQKGPIRLRVTSDQLSSASMSISSR
jgi:beta-galactosidase